MREEQSEDSTTVFPDFRVCASNLSHRDYGVTFKPSQTWGHAKCPEEGGVRLGISSPHPTRVFKLSSLTK